MTRRKAPENNAGRADSIKNAFLAVRLLEQQTFGFQFVSKAVLIYIFVLTTDGDGGFTDDLVCHYRSFIIIRGIRDFDQFDFIFMFSVPAVSSACLILVNIVSEEHVEVLVQMSTTTPG